jgi:hypothetical protein
MDQDFQGRPVAHLESSPNGRWRPNHQIEREAGRNAPADSRGLFGRRARMGRVLPDKLVPSGFAG